MIDILKFVKSSTIIGLTKRFVPRALQNKLFKFSMERNNELLRKTVLEYLIAGGGGGKLGLFLETKRFNSTEIAGLWLETTPDGSKRINIDGAFLPDVTGNPVYNISGAVVDTFLFHILGKDDYDKTDVDRFEPYMPEGPYGYRDGEFDVTVKNGDVVIDAGAWIGDFSALAACYGAVSYAFEPVKTSFDMLTETCRLNGNNIHAVKAGLGDTECETDIILDGHSGGETASRSPSEHEKTERIKITTLDKFTADAHLQKIDFIKADIEGMERNMLTGAREVLREFAPKLAICTYHLIDDPKILKDIILDANPKYKIVQRKCKLYAAVI
ncbi:MAG: FkbM family methyltransferase [Spirochaetaceae bacterium]|jgi:FkbM family methyltransferase|nr:FkbM family methyltransferase [Spirochaetaceae bacterium]